MRLINLIQGSEDWLIFRRQNLMASEISSVLGISPWKSRVDLWREKVLGHVKPVYLPATERGKALEQPALRCAEEMLEMSFTPLVVLSDEYPQFGASLDGYDPINEVVIEIKAPNQKTHNEALKGIIPDHYFVQIQWQLLVTGAKKGIYFSFSGIDGHAIWVDPCQETFDKMIKAGTAFLKSIDELEEPKATDADYIKETSSEWLEYAELKKKTTEALRQAKHDDDVVKAKLEELAAGRVRIRSEGLIYYETISKGAIDWLAFLESKGIDPKEAEAFRKAPVVRTNVRIS